MSDADLIRRQAARISELEEALRQARDSVRDSPVVIFPKAWGLARSHQKMLSALYVAPGCFVSTWKLRNIISSSDNDPLDPMAVVRVQLHYMRKRLLPFGISIACRWGFGYELPPASRAIIKAAIEERLSA
jgi:hypothetical protein